MAIDPNIQKKADDIRNKIYGKEVRESLASGLEEMSSDVVENKGRQSVVEGRQDSVESQWQAVSDEMTDKDVISAPEIIAARNGESNLKARLDKENQEVAAQLAQTEEEAHIYAPSPSAYWVAPQQPPARTDHAGHFTDGFSKTADEYINELFEPLRLANTGYISRTNLGKEQSGLYDVWRYDFTPKNYEKTIIVTGALHGGEVQGALAFYLFMKMVCENWKEHPQLAYLRHKVRVISIPIANPWGLSQLPRVRANVNGVNLNRNFDYRWSSYPGYGSSHADYKGTAVWSEKETQYVRDLVSQNSDAIAFLDLHALGEGSGKKALLYSPRSGNVGNESMWVEFLNWFTDNGEYKWMMNEVPMSCNWASKEFGMYSVVPEWVTREWGSQTFDSPDVTKSVEFFGNIILMYAKEFKTPKVMSSAEPFVRRANYLGSNPNPLQMTGYEYVAVPELTLEFEVPSSGIILLNGEISTKSDDPQSITYIMPTVGQPGGHIEPGNLVEAYFGVYYEGDKRTTNALSGAFPVKPSNGDGTNKVKVQLFARTSGGTLGIYRYRMNATFIPSGREDSVLQYSATGKEGQGEGAMVLVDDGFAN